MRPPLSPGELATLRARLSGRAGPAFWRSLEELAAAPELSGVLARAGGRSALPPEGLDRRAFLKLLGASLSMIALSGCERAPEEAIVPYVRRPDPVVPGEPSSYATATVRGGFAVGVLAESHEGRPTKIEGNPLPPASLGGTTAPVQAYLLSLYDPDRARAVSRAGRFAGWDACATALSAALEQAPHGEGLWFIAEPDSSPALAASRAALLAARPETRWLSFHPLHREYARAGAQRALGERVDLVHRVAAARVLLSLDADLLGDGPFAARYAREFSKGRNGGGMMSRLYAVECSPTLTGANADHRLAALPSELPDIARALAARLGVLPAGPELPPVFRSWVDAVARDLEGAGPAALIAAGDAQPPEVHHLALAMLQRLGALERTVVAVEPVTEPSGDEGLVELAAALRAGRVRALVVLGANPAHDAPADLELGPLLSRAPFSLHLSSHRDETSQRSLWHVPLSHELESWGDGRALDGTASLIQPLIAPLFESRTAIEVVAALGGRSTARAHDLVKEHWTRTIGLDESRWRRALHDGVLAGTASAPRPMRVSPAVLPAGPAAATAPLELVLRPDPVLGDGRLAHNAWLQELPRPLTRQTWGNAALVAPATAARLGVSTGDLVTLERAGLRVEAPVLVVPGHVAGAVTLHFGYGRTQAGIASGVGANAGALRLSTAPWGGPGLHVTRTGARAELALVQEHALLEGRDEEILHALDHDQVAARAAAEPPPVSARPGHPAWGMVIDLSACSGCAACVVACQAENNIPVVGPEQVRAGRAMHWLRVDRYWSGHPDAPRTLFEPMLCQHCEEAPCELVCPVGATTHSVEGLGAEDRPQRRRLAVRISHRGDQRVLGLP